MLDRGLVSASEVLRYGIRARDLSESNRVALVEIGSGRGYLVKDLESRHDPTQGSPQNERALYELAAQVPDLARFLPELVDVDESQRLMITEGLTRARRLDQRQRGGGPLGEEEAAALGEALATWHERASSLDLPPARPWILDLEPNKQLQLVDEDPALHEVAEQVRASTTLMENLETVQAAWQTSAVIHGDLRFTNILVGASPQDIRLVDWESAGPGDPRWDVAAAIQEYLSAAGGPSLRHNRALSVIGAFLTAYARIGPTYKWVPLRSFIVGRIILRVFQLANWHGDAETPMRDHLQLARDVGTAAHNPFRSP